MQFNYFDNLLLSNHDFSKNTKETATYYYTKIC